MKDPKVLVTGGAGLIGSQVVADLNQMGITKITVVDHLGTSEKWKNLQKNDIEDYLEKDELLKRIESNPTSLLGFTHIVHLGACSSTLEKDSSYLMSNNFNYTKSLALFAIGLRARFLYASSAATYGDGTFGYNDEDPIQKLKPLNAYGYSKHLFDLFAESTGLSKKILGLKYFNVFGFGEAHKADMRSLVLKGYEEILRTKKLELFKSYREDYADGEQQRDFLYVKDASKITLYLLFSENTGLINVGRGVAESWNRLAKALFKALELPEQILYKEMPKALISKYQYYTCATTNRLKKSGFSSPFTELEDAVADYVSKLKKEEVIYESN